jgi:DNA-binding beta-propeller fold protein YncE
MSVARRISGAGTGTGTGTMLAAALAFAGCGDGGVGGEGACPDEPGVICTWAGTGKLGFNLDGKPLAESNLYWPADLTFDTSGPDAHTYLVDFNNHRVREVLEDGTLETVIGTDFVGDGPEDLSDLTEAGALGTEVHLNHPTQIVPMPDGQPLLVAWHNHKLRRFDPESGMVNVICGRGAGYGGDGGPLAMALLNQPSQLASAQDGTLYILDQRNQVIRVVDPDGVIDTLAGTPQMTGYDGDSGSVDTALFNFPKGSNPPPGGGLAVGDGVLYVADTLNHRIRRIALEEGTIETIAGTGEAGYAGDDGPATEAKLNNPRKLTLGPDGRLYVGDELNHRIRAIDLESGEISTVVGTGEAGFGGDGELATEAALNRPVGVSFDAAGAMYVLDTYNSRVRRVGAAE